MRMMSGDGRGGKISLDGGDPLAVMLNSFG